MNPIRLREFRQYDYKDPQAWLRELRDVELLIKDRQMDEQVRRLRTQKLKISRERRVAALFAFGLSQRMPHVYFDFAGVERSDYDAVIRCRYGGFADFMPVQLKEFVPEDLNPTITVEKILNDLAQLPDSDDLVGLLYLNRRMRVRLYPIPPKALKLARLYFLAGTSPDRSQWMLMGDLLRSAKATTFTHPRAFREEFADLTFPPSPKL